MEGESPEPQGLTREQLIEELRRMKVNQKRTFTLGWSSRQMVNELVVLKNEMFKNYGRAFYFDLEGNVLTVTRAK